MNGGTRSSALASVDEDVPSSVLLIQYSIDDVGCGIEVSKLANGSGLMR